jgi:hypothetical protein
MPSLKNSIKIFYKTKKGKKKKKKIDKVKQDSILIFCIRIYLEAMNEVNQELKQARQGKTKKISGLKPESFS